VSRCRTLSYLIVLCAMSASAVALDRNAFTFTNYEIEVRLTPESSGFDARGTIKLHNDSDRPQHAIALQVSSSLTWHSVRIADKPLPLTTSMYTSDVDHTGALSEAIVTFPHDVPAKGTIELEVSYGGTIEQNATRLTRIGAPENIANTTEWDRISPAFTAFRGFGNVTWYPVSTEAASLSEGNSVAQTIGTWQARHRTARLAARLQCVCNLALVTSGHETAPLARREDASEVGVEFRELGANIPVIAAGDFHTIQRPEATAYYLGDDRAKAEHFALAVQEVTPFVSEWIGTPHDAPVLIDVPGAAAFDTGHTWVAPLADVAPNAMPINAVVLVGRGAVSSGRTWISEGLPQFLRVAYDEAHGGRPLAVATMKNFRAPLTDAEKQPEQNEPLVRSNDPIFYRFKAMFVWWMLRDMVGEDAVKKALHAYRPADDREPGYFQRLLRQTSTRDLEWFFDDWVYRDRGLPDFRVDTAFSRPVLNANGKVQGATVTVTVEDLNSAGAEVPVIVRTAEGEISQRVEVRGRSKAIVRIQVPAEPEQIVVNDGSVPETDVANNTFEMKKP
jgi:hypothetical protein